MSFIAIPWKKPYDVDLVKPLKNCISSYYTQTSATDINWDVAIDNLNKLRSQCISKSLDPKHESSVELLEKYYDQINSLEQKCPSQELQVSFKWRDAFDKGGSFLMSSNTLSVASLTYEKCCILFNIGAAHSHVGAMLASEGLTNDVSLKAAAKHFQSASGIFQALRHMTPTIGQDMTPDLNSDVLNFLHSIMLAQAQELFFYKASNDDMKQAIIARVANQCEDFYNEILKHLPILKLVGIERDWHSIIAMKQIAFLGIAEYHQSMVCREKKEFGEQIARLQKALDCFKQAESKGGVYYTYKKYLTKAQAYLDEAKKDNDFIYHARIPELKSLEVIGKAVLVQPISLPVKFKDSLPDPFEKLLPIAVQQAAQKLETRRQELVHESTTALREQANLLNGILASLNLPAALEDVNGMELPPSLREKAEFVKNQGGIQALERIINELPSLLQRNKEILEVTENMLKQEEESDNNFRQQFKEKWTRSASSTLNGVMKDHLTKYRNIIQNAINADDKVKRKFSEHKDMIRLLSESNNSEILRSIPSGSGSGPDSLETPAAAQLKALMNEVESLKRERDGIEEELKKTEFEELKAKFQSTMHQNSGVNEEALIVETLAEAYAPLQKKVRDCKSKQDTLIEKIRRANDQFVANKPGSNSADARRDQFMTKLAQAHDAFRDLLTNCAEGTKFYNNLTTLLVNLQGKVDDLCFARKTEAEELCKAIQNDIVSRPDPNPPTAPSYHGASDANDSNKPKPPRPPPPQVPQSSSPASVTSTSGAPAYPPYSQSPYAPYPQAPYYFPPPPLPQTFSSFANPYQQQPPPPQSYPNQPYPYPQQPYGGYPSYATYPPQSYPNQPQNPTNQ